VQGKFSKKEGEKTLSFKNRVFMDKLDASLMRYHLMSQLRQFDRYLHRHNIEHVHEHINDYEGIVRVPKKEKTQ